MSNLDRCKRLVNLATEELYLIEEMEGGAAAFLKDLVHEQYHTVIDAIKNNRRAKVRLTDSPALDAGDVFMGGTSEALSQIVQGIDKDMRITLDLEKREDAIVLLRVPTAVIDSHKYETEIPNTHCVTFTVVDAGTDKNEIKITGKGRVESAFCKSRSLSLSGAKDCVLLYGSSEYSDHVWTHPSKDDLQGAIIDAHHCCKKDTYKPECGNRQQVHGSTAKAIIDHWIDAGERHFADPKVYDKFDASFIWRLQEYGEYLYNTSPIQGAGEDPQLIDKESLATIGKRYASRVGRYVMDRAGPGVLTDLDYLKKLLIHLAVLVSDDAVQQAIALEAILDARRIRYDTCAWGGFKPSPKQ